MNGKVVRLLLLNLAAIVFALGLGETYLFVKYPSNRAYEVLHTSDMKSSTIPNDTLGYKPRSDTQHRSLKFTCGEKMYDVVYTFNSHGLRNVPSSRTQLSALDGIIAIFGGSFAFGEGLNDNETLSALLVQVLDGQLGVHNFAFRGYGPHQMLAAIEGGLLDTVLEGYPLRYAVYLAVRGHIARAAGHAPWDRHGPRYQLTQSGEVVRSGNFDNEASSLEEGILSASINQVLRKSLIVKTVWYQGRYRSGSSVKEKELFRKIVEKAGELVRSRYNATFEVVVWDDNVQMPARAERDAAEIKQILLQSKETLHLISQILPNYRDNPSAYKVHALDGHPNAKANRRLALYIQRRLEAAGVKTNVNEKL